MTDCILWDGPLSTEGYGHYRRSGRRTLAHREAYERANGSIPDGFVIDHRCHNEAAARGECGGERDCLHRRCINPDHLEAVTQQVNSLRGLNGYQARTHCRSGRHEINGPDDWVERKNGRQCRECDRISHRESKRRRRATAQGAVPVPEGDKR